MTLASAEDNERSGLRRYEAAALGPALGEQAGDLRCIAEHGVPLARGYLVPLGAPDVEARILAALRATLELGACARLSPLFHSPEAQERHARDLGVLRGIVASQDLHAEASEIVQRLRRSRVGQSSSSAYIRVLACDVHSGGYASSIDARSGDPEWIWVWCYGAAAAPFRVDRKTMRIETLGEGVLDRTDASRIADMADRAQLAIGHPLEIEWCSLSGAPTIVGVRRVHVVSRFGKDTLHRVTLTEADDRAVAPLSIDCLDRALRTTDDDALGGHRVRRVYARPYRQIEAGAEVISGRVMSDSFSTVSSSRSRFASPASILRAAKGATHVVATVTAPVLAARRFEGTAAVRLARMDGERLQTFDAASLIASLRDRQLLVIDTLRLIERQRHATGALVTGLEAVVGPLPEGSAAAIGAPRISRQRRKAHAEVLQLARAIEVEHGEIVLPESLALHARQSWERLRQSLADVRPLGIDVLPDAFGANDLLMRDALRAALLGDDDQRERSRRNVLRKGMLQARKNELGRTREGTAASLGSLAERLAASKGMASEVLAGALLRLRRGACEAGRRLVEQGALDEPEDALYLHFAEIEEALTGEPGAYAARVRYRREDDARWARFIAPRRILPGKA